MNSHWDPDDSKNKKPQMPQFWIDRLHSQPLDYAVEQGQPIPPVHKTTWLDRLWKWVRR